MAMQVNKMKHTPISLPINRSIPSPMSMNSTYGKTFITLYILRCVLLRIRWIMLDIMGS